MKRLGFLALTLILLASCSGPQSATVDPIIGTWQLNLFGSHEYDIKAGGTMTITNTDTTGAATVVNSTWSTKGSTFTRVDSDGSSTDIIYAISDDNKTMTWTPSKGGLTLTLVRE